MDPPGHSKDESAESSATNSLFEGLTLAPSNSSMSRSSKKDAEEEEEDFHDASENLTALESSPSPETSPAEISDDSEKMSSKDSNRPTMEAEAESKDATKEESSNATSQEKSSDESNVSVPRVSEEAKAPLEEKKEPAESTNDVLLNQISSVLDEDNESASPDSPDSTESGVLVQAESSINGTPTNPPDHLQSPQNSIVERISVCSVTASTPIPNADSSLRLLRKFTSKTAKFFAMDLGGTKTSSLLTFFFGKSDDINSCTLLYKELVDVLIDGADAPLVVVEDEIETDAEAEEEDAVIESILGHTGDTMSKARMAVATFCALVESWANDTKRSFFINKGDAPPPGQTQLSRDFSSVDLSDLQPGYISGEMLSLAIDCLESLVAHGCLDGILLDVQVDTNNAQLGLEDSDAYSVPDYKQIDAIEVLAESVFLCDLSSDEVELSALKFLLTTGCRTIKTKGASSQAMLRGSHLLQSIRVCYRVYLVTDKESNKTTARAALRQIVTGTFNRLDNYTEAAASREKHSSMERGILQSSSLRETPEDDPFSSPSPAEIEAEGRKADVDAQHTVENDSNFPSFEHKDAYLVLRSLCKLSMKPLSVGSGSMVTESIKRGTTPRKQISDEYRSNALRARSHVDDIPITTAAMDPALDSKMLALDLLLEVLQRTNTETINAGPQLVYAVRNYLCHSLLKNCTSDNQYVVNLSLRLFVPLIRHFRSHLKTEIEAFVTNVFFVILDSKNSTIEHKLRVVVLFEEICGDPDTLAEIFLNYDCDLSAVDLFQRIVNTLARVAKIGLHDSGINSSGIFVSGTGAARAEKTREEHRELRLEAMRAMRQILCSLHGSIVSPVANDETDVNEDDHEPVRTDVSSSVATPKASSHSSTENNTSEKHALVQIYDSKKKRREEEAKATLRFNQKPAAGIKYASKVGLIKGDDASDVAQFLLENKDTLDKTQIGEYLGREPDYQDGFPLKVLHEYLKQLDFSGLLFDEAIKFYLSGFRLPGEAQKVR